MKQISLVPPSCSLASFYPGGITVFVSGCALAALLLCSSAARATPVFSTGFEPPTYSAGALAGQNGWLGSLKQVVEGAVAQSGVQAVAANTGGQTGQNLTRHPITYNSVGNPELKLDMGVDFMMDRTEPGIFWEVLGAFGEAGFMGQVGVNSGADRITLGLANTAITGPVVTPNLWHRIDLVFDFQSRTLSGEFDGNVFATAPMFNASLGITTMVLGIDGAFPNSGASSAYFDNLLVESSSVPDGSSSAVLLSLAFAGMLGFKKKTGIAG